MGRKSGATTVFQISSANTPTASATISSSTRSSILKSAFAPSHLQLHLFASVIQSFESQQLRIHDTNTGRLRQQHSVNPGTTITCLDWGYYGAAYREIRQSSKKKRKRAHDVGEDAVIAYGTSTSEICLYSPAEAKVLRRLAGAHERGIKDFKFLTGDNLEAWSVGGDGKLVQWDLGQDHAVRTIPLPDPSIQTLASPTHASPQILCASFTPFSIDLQSSDDFRIEPFDKFKNPVHTIFRSGTDATATPETFLAVDNDRYVNIFDIGQKRLVRTLVAGSEVETADMYSPVSGTKNILQEQVLAIVTKDGVLELFARPFLQPTTVNGDLKSKRKGMTRKADAQVKLVNSTGSKNLIPIFSASLQGPDLVLASVEGGVEPSFQKVRWQDEGSRELLFEGVKEVVRVKNVSSLNTATMNGAKDMGKAHVDESRVVVVNGDAEPGSQDAAIEISSSDDETDEADEADEASEDDSKAEQKALEDVASNESDAEMADADEGDGEMQVDEVTQETNDADPTFGELLASKHPEAISVADALPADKTALTTIPGKKQFSLPSGMSLGTVLTQSLRTNDQSLLETCLHVTDEGVIQNTILRLDSSLATNLLSKLAERLADRPGRYGHLLLWVRMTIIAHGGAIAGQPEVASKLRTLYRVLNQRSQTLPSILLLKGKLDMLDAQQSFRSQLHAREGVSRANHGEPGMIYIEGQDDNWSSDEDVDEDAGGARAIRAKPRKSRKDLSDLVGENESSEDEDMLVANGLSHSDSDEEESDEDVGDQRPGGLVEVEADVSGEEDDLDDDEEGEDVDRSEDEEDSEEDDEDSSIEEFINDDSISEVEEEDDVDMDDTSQEPAVKRSKHR